MPNAQLAATELACHAVSVWRLFCTARIAALGSNNVEVILPSQARGVPNCTAGFDIMVGGRCGNRS